MAGIGFVLRKLYRQDNLAGAAGACLHSAFASAGPWLFTVLALGAISLIGKEQAGLDTLFNFRVILIYNFSFSLVMSGPVFMIATRYLADSIYARDVSGAIGMLLGALLLLSGVGMISAGSFYVFYAGMPPLLAMSAVVNFVLLSAVWLISIFISALKDYQVITRAFLLGMAVAVLDCLWLGREHGVIGLLNGFSMGLAVIIALMLGLVLAEYPYPVKNPFAFLRCFRHYPEIALGGLIYSMAIWVDKWIMWFAPEATHLDNGLRVYPNYDSAMFFAYMTTIPAMSLFLFHAETHFFERYKRFYRDIEGKAPFAKIEKNHQEILRSIFGSAGYFFLLQGTIAFLGILMAPEIIAMLKGYYMQIGMLRYGLLGAFFQILTSFLLALLSYFDSRRLSLYIQLIFLLTNGVFTWGSLLMGFEYYGYGYFLSTVVTFAVAAVVTVQYLAQLPYHTFITANVRNAR